jgi:hypothetical protein
LLRSPLHYLLSNCLDDKELKEIRDRDIDTCYSENGMAMLAPYNMCEKPYLVVKSILDKTGQHTDYEIQLGDKLKFGRATLLVREINIVKRLDKEDVVRDRVIRLREAYERTQKLKAQKECQLEIES